MASESSCGSISDERIPKGRIPARSIPDRRILNGRIPDGIPNRTFFQKNDSQLHRFNGNWRSGKAIDKVTEEHKKEEMIERIMKYKKGVNRSICQVTRTMVGRPAPWPHLLYWLLAGEH